MTFVLSYLAIVFLHWSILYAYVQCGGAFGDRDESAACLGMAFLPIFWVLAPFITGLYRFGVRNPVDWLFD